MSNPEYPPPERPALSRRHFFQIAGAAETAILILPEELSAEADPKEMTSVVLRVNGKAHTVRVEPRWSLLYVLREVLGLTAAKAGCERGECGACTVLIDGVARSSCVTLALEAAGTEVTTAEGLMHGEELGAVQQAFVEEDALQCGFCTPGQIMSVEALLRRTPEPTLEQIREAVSGNLCRCGAYNHIFRAARRAAELKKVRS